MTGNHGVSKREEKAEIKKLLWNARYLLPVHDRPAKIEAGLVIGRMQDAVPGPVVQSLPKRNWFRRSVVDSAMTHSTMRSESRN